MTQKGFTLTELLVAMSIMVLMSTMVFFNFPKFNQEVFMNRAARELASTLRESQSRAVGIVAFPGLPSTDRFPDNYGVFVAEASPSNFMIFSDLDGDGVYTNPDTVHGLDEAVPLKIFEFQRGVYISDLVSPDVSNPNPVELHVLNYRPGPTTIVTDSSGSPLVGIGPFEIHLNSQDNSLTKTVCIWLTGQISIKSGAGCS